MIANCPVCGKKWEIKTCWEDGEVNAYCSSECCKKAMKKEWDAQQIQPNLIPPELDFYASNPDFLEIV
jgi:hypothetical protein